MELHRPAEAMFHLEKAGLERREVSSDDVARLEPALKTDTLGGFSLTLVDSLDTLALMGHRKEFAEVSALSGALGGSLGSR